MNDDLDFQYGENTMSLSGCGATLMGEMWYFGGYFQDFSEQSGQNRRQVNYFKSKMIHVIKNSG